MDRDTRILDLLGRDDPGNAHDSVAVADLAPLGCCTCLDAQAAAEEAVTRVLAGLLGGITDCWPETLVECISL